MWLLLVVFVLALVVKVAFVDRSGRRSAGKLYPPGPRGLPFVGNLLEIKRIINETGYDWAAWTVLSGLYGPVYRVRMAMSGTVIVVSGREAVLEFLSRKECDGRPDTIEIRLRNFGKQRGIVFNEGPEWAEQKRFALKVLKDFGFGKSRMEDLILEDTDMLIKVINNKLLDKSVSTEDFVEMTGLAVVSSLWNLIAGQRCDISKEDSDMLALSRILNKAFRSGVVSNQLWRYIPILRYVKPFKTEFSEKIKSISAISNFFMDVVAKHKDTRIPGQPRDLIDTYLDQIESSDSDDKPSSFDELQLIVLLKDLFSAGVETTSSLIGFTVAYLAKYPEIQARVHRELDRVVGSNEILKMEHKSSLPYLNATITEVSRLANVAPTTVVHRVVSDCSILGYDVEKDWLVIGILRSIHMDSDHWVDAESFRPERFIDRNGNFLDDPWLVPFGIGRRKCPGENLAKVTLFLFVANLMQKFRFDLAPKETAPSLLGVNGFTISPPLINIVISSRSHEEM